MKKDINEIYISIDLESNGPIPGIYSMLSLGAAAFTEDSDEPISTFSINLKELEGAKEDKSTMAWWKTQSEAWKACREGTIDPKLAMERFVKWVSNIKGITFGNNGVPNNAVCVCYPAGFDFTFLYWYIKYFDLESPFSFSALDIKSFAMAQVKLPFRQTTKKNMPKKWFDEKTKHSHVAVEDAIEQGKLFIRMLAENKDE